MDVPAGICVHLPAVERGGKQRRQEEGREKREWVIKISDPVGYEHDEYLQNEGVRLENILYDGVLRLMQVFY